MEIQKLNENLSRLNLSDYILFLRQHTSLNPSWKIPMDSEKAPSSLPSPSASQLLQQQQQSYRYLPYLHNTSQYTSASSNTSSLPPPTSFLSQNLQVPFQYPNLASDVDTSRLPLGSSLSHPELPQQSTRYSPQSSFLNYLRQSSSLTSLPPRLSRPPSQSNSQATDLPIGFQMPSMPQYQNQPIDVFTQPPPLLNPSSNQDQVGFSRSSDMNMPSADSILPISNDTAMLLMQGMGNAPAMMNMNVPSLPPTAGNFNEASTSNIFSSDLDQSLFSEPSTTHSTQPLGFPRPSPPIRKRGRPEKPPVVCVKCGKVRKHKAKGMCFSCFQNQPKYSYRKEKYKRKKQMEISSSSQTRDAPSSTSNGSTPTTTTDADRRVTRSQSTSNASPTATPPAAQPDVPSSESTLDPPTQQPPVLAFPVAVEAKEDRKEDAGDKPGVGESLNTEAIVQ